MSAEVKSSTQWREKAGSLLSSSSMKLKEMASKATVAASSAAEVTSSKMKSTWETTKEEWNTKVQPKVISTWETTRHEWNSKVQPKVNAGLSTAARVTAETGSKLKTGLIEVRDKAAATKMAQQIKEATKSSFEKSKTLLAKVNFKQKNRKDPNAVFGVQLEVIVGRQSPGSRPVPRIVALCSDYLTARGLTTAHLFESEGNDQTVIRLMKLFDQDPTANIPLGTSSLDVAQLLKVYFRSLPEPLLTFELYEAIVEEGGANVQAVRRLLSQLPPVNQATLECLCGLLSGVSEKSAFNKMNSRSLATEFAPLLVWVAKCGGSEEDLLSPVPKSVSRSSSKSDLLQQEKTSPAKAALELETGASPAIMEDVAPESGEPLGEEEACSDQSAIVDFVLCMIDQHEEVFTNLRPVSAAQGV